MQSSTFQVDEATLNKWTPLQIEALQVDQIGEVTHSSCSDEITATETQRCKVRQSWIKPIELKSKNR
jgi:hypothetical protein